MLGGWRTAVQIREAPLVALAAAVAQQVERRLSVLFAVSAAHEVGLGLCSLGSARPTIPGPFGASDGSDGPSPTYENVRKTA